MGWFLDVILSRVYSLNLRKDRQGYHQHVLYITYVLIIILLSDLLFLLILIIIVTLISFSDPTMHDSMGYFYESFCDNFANVILRIFQIIFQRLKITHILTLGNSDVNLVLI